MTDLEMTKLCAEAMQIPVELHPIRGTIMRYWFMENNVEREYGPFHDDAQAMALVKRFLLVIHWNLDEWLVLLTSEQEPTIKARNTNLNRAICECVAKMMQAKK